MTYQGDFTLPSELLEQIAAQSFSYLEGSFDPLTGRRSTLTLNTKVSL